MSLIFFTVPGEPVAKARPRGRVVSTHAGRQFVSMYTPKTTVNYENRVMAAFREVYTGQPIDTPLGMRVGAYFQIPESVSQKKRDALVGQPVGKKPDIDNIIKSILDGLNTVAYTDDKLVCELAITKRYSFNPRCEITINTEVKV
jgi:Holliday junction resolvase RusA-like endonuclease